MKKLLIATRNKSKLEHIKMMLQGLDIQIYYLDDLGITHNANEDGNSVYENAKQKAQEYYDIAQIPTFSIDSGLYFTNFAMDDPIQPKAHVRRVNNKELSDEEMIDYYSNLAKENGGFIEAYYEDVNYLIDENNKGYALFVNQKGNDFRTFMMIDKPSSKRNVGWPLDSLAYDFNLGKYRIDITKDDLSIEMLAEQNARKDKGIKRLREFIIENLGL